MRTLFFVALCLIFFSSTANAGKVYIWTDKNGVEHITTAPPPENAKIKYKAATKSDSPSEIARFQAQQKAQTDRYYQEWQAAQNQPTGQNTNFSPPGTSTQGTRGNKCQSASDKWKKAYQEYDEVKNRNTSGRPTETEKRLRAAMFKAQKEEHACVFSPENIEAGNVYVEKSITTISRGKK